MARPKEAGVSLAFQEKEAQERERLESRLARHLQTDMTRLYEEGTHSDFVIMLPGVMMNVHSAIIKQRSPSFFNKYIRGTDAESVTIETDDVPGLQAFIRSVYTDDRVISSIWNVADADNEPLTSETKVDANGNGFHPETEVMTEQTTNGDVFSPAEEKSGDTARHTTWDVRTGCCPLASDLLNMYLDKCDTDIIITAQGKRFPAHRFILCARSSYFSAMLSGGWRESCAQEVNLERVSAAVVEQALLFVYGGRAQLTPDCDLGELVVVSDMYGIAGIKDIAAFLLKRDYCHFFHKPCSGCLVGVCETLPLTFSFGFEELHERCLRWSTKHFVRLWPTKPFALLPQEVLDKCCCHVISEISPSTLLDVVMDADRLAAVMPQVRWAEPVVAMTTRLTESCIAYLGKHLIRVLTTGKFLSLGTTMALGMDMLLGVMRRGVENMPVQSACRNYLHCRQLAQRAEAEDCDWSQDFCSLLKALFAACEQYMHQYVHLLVGTDGWQTLSPADQATIKEGGSFVVPEEAKKPPNKPHKTTAAARPTMLPSRQRARGSRPGSSAKTPSSNTPSPAGARSGGRTPQTPSSKKGASSPRPPGQTRLTPTTPGTSTTKTSETPAKLKLSKGASSSSSTQSVDAERTEGPAGPLENTAAPLPERKTAEPFEAENAGACCAELLQNSEKQSDEQNAKGSVSQGDDAKASGAVGDSKPSSAINHGSAKDDSNIRKAKSAGGGASIKQGSSVAPSANRERMSKLPSASKQKTSPKPLSSRQKTSNLPSTSKQNSSATGTSEEKKNPSKKPATTKEVLKPKTKDAKTAENLKKTQNRQEKKKENGTVARSVTSHVPKAKQKPTPPGSKEGDRSRTSSGSSQVSSPRSTTSGSRLPLANKLPSKRTPVESTKENDAVYAKCTSMRIAAMKRKKPFDADFDCETESVISTLSHVAVKGSRTPSLADLDLSPNELSPQDSNGVSQTSSVNVVDGPDGNIQGDYEDMQLSPAQDHSDVIVPVFNATFTVPDTVKDR